MARVELESDGAIIDTEAVDRTWSQGHAPPLPRLQDLTTPAEDEIEKLYRTKAGSYVLIRWRREASVPVFARRVNRVMACRWLLLNAGEVPDELKPLADAMLE